MSSSLSHKITESASALFRLCLVSVAGLMILFGALKLLSPSHASGMTSPDPVFVLIETRYVSYAAGIAKLLMGGWVVFTLGRNIAAVRVFLCLLLGVSVYRGGLHLLAPAATCHCGGLGSVAMRFSESVPDWVLTGLLAGGIASSIGVLLFHSRQNPQFTRHPGLMSPVAYVIAFAAHCLSLNAAESTEDLLMDFPPGLALAANGEVTITFPANQTNTTQRTFVYSTKSRIEAGKMWQTNTLPDGSVNYWLITKRNAISISAGSNTFDRATRSVTNAGRLLFAGVVYALQDQMRFRTPFCG